MRKKQDDVQYGAKLSELMTFDSFMPDMKKTKQNKNRSFTGIVGLSTLFCLRLSDNELTYRFLRVRLIAYRTVIFKI